VASVTLLGNGVGGYEGRCTALQYGGSGGMEKTILLLDEHTNKFRILLENKF
jgi:hypothetical protein